MFTQHIDIEPPEIVAINMQKWHNVTQCARREPCSCSAVPCTQRRMLLSWNGQQRGCAVCKAMQAIVVDFYTFVIHTSFDTLNVNTYFLIADKSQCLNLKHFNLKTNGRNAKFVWIVITTHTSIRRSDRQTFCSCRGVRRGNEKSGSFPFHSRTISSTAHTHTHTR